MKKYDFELLNFQKNMVIYIRRDKPFHTQKEKTMRVRINLDTMTKINQFVADATKYSGNIFLTDAKRNFIVSAKSMLGAVYSMEWDEVWCEADEDVYRIVGKYMDESVG